MLPEILKEAEYLLYDFRDHLVDTPDRVRDFFGLKEHDYSGLADPLVIGIGGIFHDGASSHKTLSGTLEKHGINMVGFRDWLYVGDIGEAADAMAADIEYVKSKSGKHIKHVVLVCHSLGALVGRDIVQRDLTDVDILFELGAPNKPTWSAGLIYPFPAGRQMFYGSDYLKRLNKKPNFNGTEVHNVFSDSDPLVPERSARFKVRGVRNKMFRGRGHAAFLYDREIIDYITERIVERYRK